MAQQRGSRRSVFRTTILYRSGPVGLFGLLKRRRLAHENCSRLIRPKLTITLRRKRRRNNSYTVVLNPDFGSIGMDPSDREGSQARPFQSEPSWTLPGHSPCLFDQRHRCLDNLQNDNRARQKDMARRVCGCIARASLNGDRCFGSELSCHRES